MFTILQALSVLAVAGWSSASKWDEGLDGDLLGELPAPTADPYLTVNELYPELPWGAVPLSYAPGSSKRKRLGMEGRLGIRAPTCDDAGFILACPISEHLPCCPAAHPICCHDPSDTCCSIGSFCVGTHTCCYDGQKGCGEGCCEASQTCCGGHCCESGLTCQNGSCVRPVDPQQSFQSVQSIQSVASVQSIQMSVSLESIQSTASVSVVAGQSLASLSSVSLASVASLSRENGGNQPNPAPTDNTDNTDDTGTVTSTDPRGQGKRGNNGVVIGGSIGGALGALLLVGCGIAFFLRRKSRNSSPTTPATPSQPMMQPYSPMAHPHSPTTATGTAAQSPYTNGYFGPVPVTAPALVYNETTQPHHSTSYSPPSSAWTQSQQVDQQGGSSTGVTNSPSSHPVPMWLQRNEAPISQPTPTSPAPDYTSQHGGHALYPSVAAMFYGAPNSPTHAGPSTGTANVNYDYPLDKGAKGFSG